MTTVVLIPGLWNSGPEHWQSYWEKSHPGWRRLRQAEWETPHVDDWARTLEQALADVPGDAVLAAHSLGCCLVAHWAAAAPQATLSRVRGALLVAPSDVEAPTYPKGTTGFQPMPLRRLPFQSTVVASSNDEYVSLERASQFARAWGSKLALAGDKGHINSASALRDWPEGLALVQELITQANGS